MHRLDKPDSLCVAANVILFSLPGRSLDCYNTARYSAQSYGLTIPGVRLERRSPSAFPLSCVSFRYSYLRKDGQVYPRLHWMSSPVTYRIFGPDDTIR